MYNSELISKILARVDVDLVGGSSVGEGMRKISESWLSFAGRIVRIFW